MKNPLYIEYRRSTLLGILLVLLLSALGAVVHYVRSLDDNVVQTKFRLSTVGNQLDSEFTPVLAFMEAVRRASLLKMSLPAVETDESLLLLQLSDGRDSQVAITAPDEGVDAELLMLWRLQPYFELATETQPHLVGMYYFSEQGFAFNGQAKWSDYIVDHLLLWYQKNMPEPAYERGQIFFTEFLPGQAAVMLPLYAEERKLGHFVFALALEPLLAPVYQQHSDADFVLLDQSGQLINSSLARPPQDIDQHVLQIQRLNTMPWSLGLLEQKTSLFASGLKEFIWHWFSYAVLLGLLLVAMQYRYRLRTLTSFSRLLVHIERLSQGRSQGVRRIPFGWQEVFERISRLKQPPSQ
ncbi:hypothetical protein [Rheinheimera aquimaris]|uniref:hypothetical protein n=1 Tax=Rheinheimera aquimaris TaxID=412437 RepID=UPI001E37A333|nr:hypothetical protein [Rheinheimera aquimaris]MCD1597220.1 hypothetical protein [Rheinheimera aquimaris]